MNLHPGVCSLSMMGPHLSRVKSWFILLRAYIYIYIYNSRKISVYVCEYIYIYVCMYACIYVCSCECHFMYSWAGTEKKLATLMCLLWIAFRITAWLSPVKIKNTAKDAGRMLSRVVAGHIMPLLRRARVGRRKLRWISYIYMQQICTFFSYQPSKSFFLVSRQDELHGGSEGHQAESAYILYACMHVFPFSASPIRSLIFYSQPLKERQRRIIARQAL